jgi:hypothetical protein
MTKPETQPNSDPAEIEHVEEAHDAEKPSLSQASSTQKRSVGFQALRTPGDWGPAHHRNDESPIIDGID